MDTTPGGLRELQNVIERSVILSEPGVFAVDETWCAAKADIPASTLESKIKTLGIRKTKFKTA